MPMRNLPQNTSLATLLQERANDVRIVTQLERTRLIGRVRLDRSQPSSSTDVIQGDALGDRVFTGSSVWELQSLGGELQWIEIGGSVSAPVDTPTRITITGSYTLSPPSSPTDFQRAKYWIVASGADRALTLDASIIVPTSSAFTSPVTIVNGKKAKVLIEYDASKAQWELTSFLNGY